MISFYVLLDDIIKSIYSISVPSIETGGDLMSNHSGSYMLNDIIQMLNDEEVLNTIGLQKSQQVISQIVKIASREYDCNPGEILEGHTDYLNLCYCCLAITTNLDNGLCHSCRS